MFLLNVGSHKNYTAPHPRRWHSSKEEIPLNIKSTSADLGSPSKGTWSDKSEGAEEEGMETGPSLSGKEEWSTYTQT
jgi:hypothetical protein